MEKFVKPRLGNAAVSTDHVKLQKKPLVSLTRGSQKTKQKTMEEKS